MGRNDRQYLIVKKAGEDRKYFKVKKGRRDRKYFKVKKAGEIESISK